MEASIETPSSETPLPIDVDGESNTEQNTTNTSPETTDHSKFEQIMRDFLGDLLHSFPEYSTVIASCFDDNKQLKTEELFNHCKTVYPEHFFNILYKNDMDNSSEASIHFHIIPDLDIQDLWKLDGTTDSMKDTIWKYLQLVLFSVVGDIDNKSVFGETSKLFEAIDESQLRDKMETTMEDLMEMFNKSCDDDDNEHSDGGDETNSDGNENPDFLNPDNMQEHLSSLLDGKLGKLATEIAEETAQEFEMDMDNLENSQDAMKQLMSNPGKLMDLVKKVGGKLDDKIKSGDLKESELMEEAGELMKKMQGMGGMKDIKKMFKNMPGGLPDGLANMIPNMGKNMRVNTSALNSKLKRQETEDRMRKKAQERVQELNKKKQIEEEYERKRKEFLDNAQNFDVDKIMKDLGLENEPVTKHKSANSTQKKKKKKKGKK